LIMTFLRRLFGMKPKSEVSSEIDEVIEELADKVEEEEVLPTEEVVEETPEPVGEPRLTWPQFRSAHKGMVASEISDLWKEYKDGSYEVRNS